MTTAYERMILASPTAFDILTAAPEVGEGARLRALAYLGTVADPGTILRMVHAPQANGFYGSKGISFYIPAAYTCIETNFLRDVEQHGATDRVRVWEYNRKDWTFHAKGTSWPASLGVEGRSRGGGADMGRLASATGTLYVGKACGSV